MRTLMRSGSAVGDGDGVGVGLGVGPGKNWPSKNDTKKKASVMTSAPLYGQIRKNLSAFLWQTSSRVAASIGAASIQSAAVVQLS